MNPIGILNCPPTLESLAPRTTLRKIMRRYWMLFMLVALKSLLICDVGAAERKKPVLIGVLTQSWGPTPGGVGLGDGLKKLGYHENQYFVIAAVFTQGSIAGLPQAPSAPVP